MSEAWVERVGFLKPVLTLRWMSGGTGSCSRASHASLQQAQPNTSEIWHILVHNDLMTTPFAPAPICVFGRFNCFHLSSTPLSTHCSHSPRLPPSPAPHLYMRFCDLAFAHTALPCLLAAPAAVAPPASSSSVRLLRLDLEDSFLSLLAAATPTCRGSQAR